MSRVTASSSVVLDSPEPTPGRRQSHVAGLTGLRGLAAISVVLVHSSALSQYSWLGLHGFGDYSINAFDLPAPLFTARGVAIYAYDQRGFGAAPHRFMLQIGLQYVDGRGVIVRGRQAFDGIPQVVGKFPFGTPSLRRNESTSLPPLRPPFACS